MPLHEVFEPPSDSEPDLLANRWRAKYEKQKGVVEGGTNGSKMAVFMGD